jgi:hypothetical protein
VMGVVEGAVEGPCGVVDDPVHRELASNDKQ